jgi:hypothetical protein
VIVPAIFTTWNLGIVKYSTGIPDDTQRMFLTSHLIKFSPKSVKNINIISVWVNPGKLPWKKQLFLVLQIKVNKSLTLLPTQER